LRTITADITALLSHSISWDPECMKAEDAVFGLWLVWSRNCTMTRSPLRQLQELAGGCGKGAERFRVQSITAL